MSDYKVNCTDPGDLQAKIKEAKKTARTTTQHLGRAYELFEIELGLEEAYYNIQNYRSKKECDEYVKEHNLPKDTFSKDNFFSKTSQQHYHKIIYSQVMEDPNTREAYEAEFGDAPGGKEASQTQNLYLSFDGVLANGNSRSSYWRENNPKHITSVRYWVFPDGISWEELEDAVLTLDARKDITQRLPWYNIADKARERSQGVIDKDTRNKIAKSQQYKDANHMSKEIEKLALAERFINTKRLQRFNSFKDLSKLGVGSGIQAFDTLQKGIEKCNKDKFKALISMPTIMNALIEDSFTVIDDQAKSLANAKDVHIAIGLLFSDARLEELINTNAGKEEIEDPIIGSDKSTKLNENDKHRAISEIDSQLLIASESKKLATAKRNADALAKNLTDINTKIERYQVLLNDKTNYQTAQKAMKKLIKTIEKLDEKIDNALGKEN